WAAAPHGRGGGSPPCMGGWRAAPEGQRRRGSAAPSPGCAGYFPINGEDTHRDSPLDTLGRRRAARGTGRGGRGRGRRPDPGRCDGRPLRAEPDLRATGGGGGPPGDQTPNRGAPDGRATGGVPRGICEGGGNLDRGTGGGDEFSVQDRADHQRAGR